MERAEVSYFRKGEWIYTFDKGTTISEHLVQHLVAPVTIASS